MRYNSFSEEPKINVNPHNPKKAFTLLNDICYTSNININSETYRIAINKGYNWNGANIPRFLWRLVGSQYNPEFLPASMVHDWLCENKKFIIKDGVKISSDIFKDILILYGVPKAKAWIMASAVRAYQMTKKDWN
jgi:hypothetical protein